MPDGTKVANWTSVPVKFVDMKEGHSILIPVEQGAPAHVKMEHDPVLGCKYITRTVFSDEDNLPEPVEGVFLIVSSVFKSLYPDRDDLVVPNRIIRNSGEVMACQGFAL